MTGITRVSKESIFSDLNNLKVVTTTSNEYATTFGFTEEEVFAALEEAGLADQKAGIKEWYEGFIFGNHRDIYNPWSILNCLDTGKYGRSRRSKKIPLLSWSLRYFMRKEKKHWRIRWRRH